MTDFPAHIKENQDTQEKMPLVQTVQEHCRNTAQGAAAALKSVHLGEAGYLAGLLHDCGKFKTEFSDYIWAAFQGKPVHRGSVNHTFAGCRLLLDRFHTADAEGYPALTAELLAFAVGAHHGLFDCVNESGENGFCYRQEKEDIHYEESRDNFLRLCADGKELKQRFQKADEALRPVYESMMAQYPEDDIGNSQLMFSVGLLARLLLSAVIEGDRLDTMAFMTGHKCEENLQHKAEFWNQHLITMEKRLACFPRNTEIEQVRGEFSDRCRAAAEKPSGIYRLNLPTGGGKTLSSLRYALAHAAQWEKQRIIFVTPLLAILEQNAEIIRKFIGDDSIILEHHSNVIEPEEASETLDFRELAVENWNAPVIITTLVQLLNTLFLGKTTSIRRFHSLCNAVVVIDEVQTVPDHMLSLFNTAVNFLSRICGTTFLLCSATQPCFEKAEHPLLFGKAPDVVPYDEQLWKPFCRTTITGCKPERLEQIPELARRQLQETDSLLIICNKKMQSEFLYQNLAKEDAAVFHISSAMCMAHRRDVLSKIESSLEEGRKTGQKTICVSTQVMEAGVDISFGAVMRLAAGMDSVVQSAGRCNRNGENPACSPVWIIPCMDENLGKLREIRNGKQVTIALLEQFQRDAAAFSESLDSEQAIRWYYEHLFREQEAGYQQFFVKGHGYLFDLMAENENHQEEASAFTLCQAFQTAGKLFHVLDEDTRDVVVPYGQGAELIEELRREGGRITWDKLRIWMKKSKPYTVSIYEYQQNQLEAGLEEISGIWVLRPEYYDPGTGLIKKPEAAFLEV